MPSIYVPMSGVNTKQKNVYGLISGVNTKMKSGFSLINGANAKVYNSWPNLKSISISNGVIGANSSNRSTLNGTILSLDLRAFYQAGIGDGQAYTDLTLVFSSTISYSQLFYLIQATIAVYSNRQGYTNFQVSVNGHALYSYSAPIQYDANYIYSISGSENISGNTDTFVFRFNDIAPRLQSLDNSQVGATIDILNNITLMGGPLVL